MAVTKTQYQVHVRNAVVAWILLFVSLYIDGLSQACECGRSVGDRIFDGYPVASSSQYPWMCSLLSVTGDELQLCGCSLISSRYVVTAGHCKPSSSRATSFVTFGIQGAYQSYYGAKRYPVEKFISKYDGGRGTDIAVAKLSKAVNFPVICLPPSGLNVDGVEATMLGFGNTERGNVSSRLLAADIVVPSNARCARVQPISSKELCGGNYNDAPSFCSGDSGGPLMYYNSSKTRWFLIGVISGSYSCYDDNTYGVFTRVSSYSTWIQQVTNNTGCVK